MSATVDYIRDPAQIYQQSFEMIRREADLSRFSNAVEELAVRLIHACGMVDIVDDLIVSEGAMEAGRAAIGQSGTIICDVEMVRRGIIARLLPEGMRILCNVAAGDTAALAKTLGTTRSAAAFEALGENLPGSIVVIGNAPTALFHLLEMMDRGAGKPTLIIGIPVGFVGAVEAKEALIENSRGVPYIAVRGRRGGSAMAAAAMNAIAGGLSA